MPIFIFVFIFISTLKAEVYSSKDISHFLNYEKNQQILHSMRSLILQSQSILNDSWINVSADLNRSYGDELSPSSLSKAGGLYPELRDTLNTRLSLLPRNVGRFNSTRVDITLARTGSEYQILPGASAPNSTATAMELKFSYDVIKGGRQDPLYLQGQGQQAQLDANFYQLASSLVNNFFEYQEQILDLKAAYCKLELAKKDHTIVQKTAKEVEIAYQLKSTNYKQYLNIIDTKNFIERNLINYELQFENQKRILSLWQGKLAPEQLQAIVKDINCLMSEKDIREARTGISIKSRKKKDFKRTLDYQIIRKELAEKQFALKSNQVALLPELRPYISLSRENQVYDTDKRIAVGISVNWDVPGKFQKNIVKAGQHEIKSTSSKYEASSNQFFSDSLVLANLIEKNKNLLELSLRSLENSDKLIKLLEVQKNIGQIDTVSLSNAYTQRNQILNSIFDSVIAIRKNFIRWKLQTEWKEFITKSGINIQ
jgi:hypothetical protein